MKIDGKTIVQETKHSIWRTVSVLIVLLIFGGAGFGIYSAFKKPTQNIVAKKGSTVTVNQINKTSRVIIPFAEVGVDQHNDEKMATYVRVGLRWEF